MINKSKPSEFIELLTPLRPYLFSAALFSCAINILMIVPAIYMLQVYDRAVGNQSLATLTMLTVIMIALLIAMGILDWTRGQIMSRASIRFDELLSKSIFERNFRQSLLSGGRTNSQPLQDFNRVKSFIDGPTVNAFFDIPWLPIYILIMFAFHLYFGLIAILSVFVLATLALLNQKTTQKHIEEANKELSWVSNFVNSHIRNAEVIESMGMMSDIRQRWHQRNQSATQQQTLAGDRSRIYSSSSKALRIMLQSLTLGLGAYLAINNEISGGMMIAGSILLGRALSPVDQLIGGWKSFQQVKEQFKRIDALFTNIPANKDKMILPEPKGDISVEAIRVVPPGSRVPILNGVSFNITAGTILGIIGPSASGKSTLARALLGIWPTVTGSVRLDNADVFKWNPEELGKHVGYLPQDIELFEGSISDNISRFTCVDSKSEQIVEAARLAGVHDMILHLPNGYDTVIGASGPVLSGGHRQRIGLARALFGNPRLVILDEPNSNLDDAGELALRQALQYLKNNRVTVVVITHRPNILSVVDKILVLKDGASLDFGAADMIIKKYQKVSSLQKVK